VLFFIKYNYACVITKSIIDLKFIRVPDLLNCDSYHFCRHFFIVDKKIPSKRKIGNILPSLMYRSLLILTGLLFLLTASADDAFAKKHHHHLKQPEPPVRQVVLNTDSVSADSLITFAKTFLNTPYRAASSDTSKGFDCSGFVSFVFKSFNVKVPRSSCEFTGVGEKINVADAKPGDILLFTGTKSHHPHSIGHVAIVFSNDGNQLKFIHSTSGKEYCVTISAMDETYRHRFVKAVRLLKQNNYGVLACQ